MHGDREHEQPHCGPAALARGEVGVGQGTVEGEQAAGPEQHGQRDERSGCGFRAGLQLRCVEGRQQQREHARREHDPRAEAEQQPLHARADVAHHEQRYCAERGRGRGHRATRERARYGQLKAFEAAHELRDQQGEPGQGDEPAAQCAQRAGRAGRLEMQADDFIDHDGTPRVAWAMHAPRLQSQYGPQPSIALIEHD